MRLGGKKVAKWMQKNELLNIQGKIGEGGEKRRRQQEYKQITFLIPTGDVSLFEFI